VFKTSMALSPLPAQFAPLLFAGNWREGVRAAKELGYDAVEVSLRQPTESVVAELLRGIGQAGLALSAVATGQCYLHDGLSLASLDPDVQAELRSRMCRFIDLASSRGALVILGGVRGRLTGDPSTFLAQRARAVAAAREYADYAAPRGVSLAIEPLNRYETNFLNTLREGMAFIEEAGSQNLGLLADTFHMNIEEPSLEESLKGVRNRLRYVHLADSNRGAPGQGHSDLGRVAQALREIGYDGYLSAEILPLPDPRSAAAQAISYYRSLG
jgi:sugar phosphate isomerase/epimerase